MPLTLFELVSTLLPPDFDPRDLLKYGKPEWWKNRELLALAYSLRKCPNIDWQAYLAANPDVRAANIDPVLHFLNDGIFEARRLYTHTVVPEESKLKRPLVSILVCNHNNALYLEKSIGTLVRQSLTNIEIIIVDDASTDDSIPILRSMANQDKRINLIEFPENLSVHMARKAAVAAASGIYIMFLDSDDYYTEYTCEIAFKAIQDKYDFVCFNMSFIFPDNMPAEARARLADPINRGPERIYESGDILPAIYETGQLSDMLLNKIYRASICKEAFSNIDDGYLLRGEDLYEAFAIVSRARSAAKINRSIYIYRIGSGITQRLGDNNDMALRFTHGITYGEFKKYLEKTGHKDILDFLSPGYKYAPVRAWVKEANEDNCRDFFNMLASQYGIQNLLASFIDLHYKNPMPVAEKFYYYGCAGGGETAPRSIGLLYSIMYDGGAERVLWELAPALIRKGYDVTVFLEKAHVNDSRFRPPAKVVYLGAYGNGLERMKSLLAGLERALEQNPVGVMLCHACYDSDLLWQIMLLKYLGIPTILFPHSAFYARLSFADSDYPLQLHAAILRLGEKVSVLSRYEELFYHNQGIDARYIHNPVRLPDPNWCPAHDFELRKNNLVVSGRLSAEAKNVNDCLLVLKEITNVWPWVQMTFIGNFSSRQERQQFLRRARELGLLDNIKITGWLDDTTRFIDSAAILLSCAWQESFGLAIVEAQARGLPVVMYDLPIAPAQDNPAIIRVPQRDIRGMANAIIALLNDEARWYELSSLAFKNAKKYDIEDYVEKICELLGSYAKLSILSYYKPEDYRTVLRTLGFYAGEPSPWHQVNQ